LLNKQSLSIEAGVDGKTIDAWLGILEESFIICRLYPHHANFNKRVVKMPKLYFTDTGLACTLLGIQTTEQLVTHPLYGSLFENLVIIDLLKIKNNLGLPGELFFWRDNTGHEIDLVIAHGDNLFPIEIKSGQTIMPDFFRGLNFWEKLSGNSRGALIYGGPDEQQRSTGIRVVSWVNLDARMFIEDVTSDG
jgi:predicted AAA+ superfamily ATPase